ncbi:EthD domain-containing protein [Variovorax dokdonensis]
MTLLARKEGMSTSDFRAYWAGPHAKLALGMNGITKYTHNRVDKVLWTAGDHGPAFDVDGIVELFFADAEVMRMAQASSVGKKFIPEDEPGFLKGWTLCVVDEDGDEPGDAAVKVMIPFHAEADVRDSLWRSLKHAAEALNAKVTLNWTVSTARRERLWAEPAPPTGFVGAWFDSVAAAHEAFEPSCELRRVLESSTVDGAAYLIDQLRIR